MAAYEPGDMATFYFVVRDDHRGKMIKGWTDSKRLAEFYMAFHDNPNMTLKKLYREIEEIREITNKNTNDEIGTVNLKTRDDKYPDRVKTVTVPITEHEMSFVISEAKTFCDGMVRWSDLNNALDYLKPRYRKALEILGLRDILSKIIYENSSEFSDSIDIDEVAVLAKCVTKGLI